MQLPPNAGKKNAAKTQAPGTVSDHLYHLAFTTSLQASILSTVQDGRILDVNTAACKLLGYAKKELPGKSLEHLLHTSEGGLNRFLTQRAMMGYARGCLFVHKKNGKQLPCEITSAIFIGEHGIAKAITTMVDVSENMVKQKEAEARISFLARLKERDAATAALEAHELERSEIGKELHDNVNQLLSLSHLYLDMARKGGVKRDMYLNHSSQCTRAAIEEIRKISKGLVTDVIKDFGLGEAITDISRDTMEVHPVKITCTVDELIETRVNDKFKHDVFRIVQEQLTNIVKHAKASSIKIGLSQTKNTIFLIISDNGVGFDTAQKQGGIGMTNIKSRAAFYTGTANFVSRPGQGCNLTVTFPVTDTLLNKE